MLTPVQRNLTLYPNGTFDPLFAFFTDAAQTEPVDLTGYQAVMVIGAGGELLLSSAGPGLTIDGPAGTVQALATPAQTAALTPGVMDWFLQWTAPDGSVDYPAGGQLTVCTP